MRIGIVVAIAVVFSSAAFGHHSFDAEFDGKKPVSIDGIVTKVEWINPHSYIYLDVADKDGKVTNYAVEGGPVGMLRRWGIAKGLLNPGDKIHLNGYASKDGSPRLAGRDFILPDGTRKQMGPPVN